MIRPFNVTISKWSSQYNKCVDAGYEFYPHEILPSEIDPPVPDNPDEPEPSAVLAVNAQANDRMAVYSLSGKLVGTATIVDGKIKAEGLKAGLYVVGGKKLVVR